MREKKINAKSINLYFPEAVNVPICKAQNIFFILHETRTVVCFTRNGLRGQVLTRPSI